MNKELFLASLICLATVSTVWRLSPPVRAIEKASNAAQSQPRRRAPELTGGRGWLNTDKPLSLAGLKGKIVLLDFWTYGCINCLHIIPDLEKLERKYANQLVIIGVHSGKYENEKETDNIRRVIVRYDIAHPVYNDADFAVWRAYNVNAWPTRVLIDPAGYIVGYVPGEGNYEPIDQAINQVAADFRARGELNEQPLRLALERARVGDLPLAFPGKVLADGKTNRLFIADSGHNRIVVTSLDGAFIEAIGTGKAAAVDGPSSGASFYRPQGMALDGDFLYVADTDNHLIRRVDLKAHSVVAIAGTGHQARGPSTSGPARSIDVNSPWDLQLVGRSLYIAMAGPHQIWKLDLDQNVVGPFAGEGREGRRDGPLSEARFSQPSGITSDGKVLYTADSEANVIREIDPGKGEVRTLAGANLFEFGDQDGYGDEVRFQHPLGVFLFGNKILIADTYNHKIKELDPRKRTVRTLLGNGKPGQKDGGSSSFFEPSGLSVANGKLYVADTNNHAIRVVDLPTKETSTLGIEGLQPPATTISDATDSWGPNPEEIKIAPQRLRAGIDGTLVINVELPAGYHLNSAAPQRFRVGFETVTGALTLDPRTSRGSGKDLHFPVRVPLAATTMGSAKLLVQLTLFYCRQDNTGTCRIKTLLLRAPVEVTDAQDAPQEIEVRARVEAK
ncbi:MAG TPA: thioredoxin-like domain-containing protein [Pyrinomonadaceae bacterium]|nr:thioredoxin-like domain-containing protein [Pyrinomonadaceae bacterium]